ncbi:hypothetical protein IV417_02590 [Alphaproteobacteria bacterium KMM 3653]|uniref:Uncharacterized protein n=1 Tax=Harenicola maris TaxID=2841044 RepID=A0AAP2G6X0_9RHOB|nr:hypothetical protein [Harenicola maris]
MIGVIGAGLLTFGIAILVAIDAKTSSYIIFGVAWFVWAWLALGIENKNDQSKMAKWAPLLSRPYPYIMGKFTKGLPKLLLPNSAEKQPPPKVGVLARLNWWTMPRAVDGADLITLAHRPWSWPVMDMAIRISILYPLAFAMTQWAIAGDATGIGQVQFFPDGIPWPFRYATFALISSLILFRIMASASGKLISSWLHLCLMIIVGSILIIVTVTFADTSGFSFAFAAVVISAVAVFTAVALTSAIAIVYAFAFADTAAVPVAIVATTILIVGVSASTQKRVGLLGYFLLLTFSLACTMLAAISLRPEAAEATVLVLGLALLPFINAVFDWFSYGLTIWLLRRGYQRGGFTPWLCAMVDAIAAAIIFFTLSLSICAAFALINANRAEDLVNVAALLTTVKETPSEAAWAIAMVASTLVPTLLHIAVAILAAVTWFPEKFWTWQTERLDGSRSGQVAIPVSLALTASLFVYAAIPVAALYGVGKAIWSHGGAARVWYVETLESTLRVMGLL